MYLDEFNIVTDEMDNFDDALKARDAMRQKTSRRRKNEIKKKNRREKAGYGHPGLIFKHFAAKGAV